MTIALSEVEHMARKKVAKPGAPMGFLIAKNLARLGYSETVIKATEVARLVTERTGKNMTRQRVASIINAIEVSQETLATLAKGLGVKPSELTRED